MKNQNNSDRFRDQHKKKAVQQMAESFNRFLDIAKKSVLDPDSMTEQEEIFHNSSMHYDPKLDAPNVKIKTFDEWKKDNPDAAE